MSNSEYPQVMQGRNCGLIRRQYRLRHLRSVAARNITVKDVQPASLGEITQLQVHLTLHQNATSDAFYTSDVIKGSLNPTWPILGLSNIDDHIVNTAASSFVARVWHCWHGETKLCIEWHVELAALDYLGSKMPREGGHSASNSLVFGMFDGFYGIRPPSDTSPPEEPPIAADLLSTRNSYSVQTIFRIQTIVRAIKQTHGSVKKVRQAISERLAYSETVQEKIARKELLLTNIQLMGCGLTQRFRFLEVERQVTQLYHNCNEQREASLKKRFDQLQKHKEQLDNKKREYFEFREELVKSGAQLVMRRKQLISDLSLIYPVVQGENGHYLIAGVRLPNSEDFDGEDEEMLAVALGYTNHLVLKISQFLNVPLRYPMLHQGSRSRIYDYIIDKLSDKERDFPLYSKGKERFHFNYAVFLLNKNIAQLRYYCGLGTKDLRLTLPNLSSLLELRLGIKLGMHKDQAALPSVVNDTLASSSNDPDNSMDSSPHKGKPQQIIAVDGSHSDSSDPFKSSPDSFFSSQHEIATRGVATDDVHLDVDDRCPAWTNNGSLTLADVHATNNVHIPADDSAIAGASLCENSIEQRTDALSSQCSTFKLKRTNDGTVDSDETLSLQDNTNTTRADQTGINDT